MLALPSCTLISFFFALRTRNQYAGTHDHENHFPSNIIFVFGLTFAFVYESRAHDSPQDYVNAHNTARSQVGGGPITWDATVAAFAHNYANQRKGNCRLVHSSGPYGENIAWSSGDLSGTAAVNLWVAEKAEYNYNSNSCAAGRECGHYTQVVWRNSVRLGCAKVRCNNGGTFITCNYDPRGNIVGQKPY